MKKKDLGKKLRISKETVTNLDNPEMQRVQGGYRSDPTQCPIQCSIISMCGYTICTDCC